MAGDPFTADPRPIGVFDSGVGGLTVLKALMESLPEERFIYLGDTARVPYGTKSAGTVRAYALNLARVLLCHDVKMIVIACNTASAHATEAVARLAEPVPVIGMIAPAVVAALAATRNNHVMVLGTRSTVQADCYGAALRVARPGIKVDSIPAQLLVALAEEGWTDGPVARGAVERYIGSTFDGGRETPDTIILGCTHFPLLKEIIADIAGPGVTLIESGAAAASSISSLTAASRPGTSETEARFYVTDSVGHFRALAERFLEKPLGNATVEQIDCTRFDTQTETETAHV